MAGGIHTRKWFWDDGCIPDYAAAGAGDDFGLAGGGRSQAALQDMS
jgi:hypothetical protein